MNERITSLIESLHDIGAVKFGEFRLKSGSMSPIYVDLRVLPSFPKVLSAVAEELSRVAAGLRFDRIAAIPYGGLPIGVALALEMNRSLIYPRKEAKEHGTRRAIEGVYNPGDTILVVDDLISTGGSKLEAIEPLLAENLIVRDVLVIIDREQGGREELASRGYSLHSLLSLPYMLDTLVQGGRITADQAADVLTYIRGHK